MSLNQKIKEIKNKVLENKELFLINEKKEIINKEELDKFRKEISNIQADLRKDLNNGILNNKQDDTKKSFIRLYEALTTLRIREVTKQEFVNDILENKTSVGSLFVKETGSEVGVRLLSKNGLGNKVQISKALTKIKRQEQIKVKSEALEEVYEGLLDALVKFSRERNITDLKEEVKSIIESNKPIGNSKGVSLFVKSNLQKGKKEYKFGETLVSNIIHSNDEKFDWSKYGEVEQGMVNSVFSTLLHHDTDFILNMEAQTSEIGEECIDNELLQVGEELGQSIANKIIDTEFEHFKVDIESGLDKSSNFTYKKIVEDIKKQLNDQQLQENEIAEIVSIYVNFFQNDFGSLRKDFINENNSLNFDNINLYIANNSFTYCKINKKKTKKPSTVKDLSKKKKNENYEEVTEFIPLFELTSDKKLKRLGKPTSGSIDNVYYSVSKQKTIGTSTTVDTTGTIEGDQFARHAFKNKLIGEFLNKAYKDTNETNWKDKNIYNEIQEYISQNSENKKEYKELLDIQSFKTEETFIKVIETYNERHNTNENQITKEVLVWLFEDNQFNFDIFGSVVTKDSRSLNKYLEVLAFLEKQKSEDFKRFYSEEVLNDLYKYLHKRVKNFSTYTELTSGNNLEKSKKLEQHLIKLSNYVTNYLIDDSQDRKDFIFIFDKETMEKLQKNEEISTTLQELEKTWKEMIENLSNEKLKEELLKQTNIEGLIEEQFTFYRNNLNTRGYKHQNVLILLHISLEQKKLNKNPDNIDFLNNFIEKMLVEGTKEKEPKDNKIMLPNLMKESLLSKKEVAEQKKKVVEQKKKNEEQKKKNEEELKLMELVKNHPKFNKEDYLGIQEELVDEGFGEYIVERTKLINKRKLLEQMIKMNKNVLKENYPHHYKIYKEEEEILRKEEVQYMELLKENNKTEMVELIKNEIKKNGRNFNLTSFVVELYLKNNVENKKTIEKQINNLKETQKMKVLPKEMEEELNKQIITLLNEVKESLNEEEKEIIEETINNEKVKKEIKKSSSNLFK